MDIDDIRDKLGGGRYELSRHAQRRIVERNISAREITGAAYSAEIIEDYPDDKYLPSCLILLDTPARPLHIQVCYSNPETLKLITIYEPAPEKWADLRTRRRS